MMNGSVISYKTNISFEPIVPLKVQDSILWGMGYTAVGAAGGAILGSIFSTASQWSYFGACFGFHFAIANLIYQTLEFLGSLIPDSLAHRVDAFFSNLFGIRTYKELEGIEMTAWSTLERIRSIVLPVLRNTLYQFASHFSALGINCLIGLAQLSVIGIVTSVVLMVLRSLIDHGNQWVSDAEKQKKEQI